MKRFLTKDNLNRTTETESYDQTDFVDSYTGSQAPIKTDPSGKIDESLLPPVAAESAKEIVSPIVYGETISALKLIYAGADGKAYLATANGTYNQASVIGITKSAGNLGDTRQYLLFGRIDDGSFAFPAGADLFLDVSGNIVDSFGATGHYKPVGQSLGTGSIFINIKSTIVL